MDSLIEYRQSSSERSICFKYLLGHVYTTTSTIDVRGRLPHNHYLMSDHTVLAASEFPTQLFTITRNDCSLACLVITTTEMTTVTLGVWSATACIASPCRRRLELLTSG